MRTTFVFLSVVLIAIGILARPVARAAGPAVVVVMAAAVGVRDISMADLRRVFLGLPTAVGGKRLIPINLPNNDGARHAFDRAILGLEPGAVGKFWIDRRIRDESAPPRSVPAAALAAKVAASLPGAITYIPTSLMNDKLVELAVDGNAPGSGGYPIK